MLEVTYTQPDESYNLSQAMLFYQGRGDTIATLHKIRDRRLLAGKCVSMQDIEELFHSEHQQRKMIFMPPEVVAWSRNEIVWLEKSRIRPIYFNAPEPERQFLNGISGKHVVWPNLLFRISQNNISCWALGGNRKPNLKTKLYRPPFTNIFNDFRFCPPNQFREIRDENIIEFARRAVDLFFLGHFSHLYSNMERSISYSRGLDRFWVKMAKDFERGKSKVFPSRYLIPTTLTLRSILS